jgi:predicted TIM-barrel fold metal-dependent hydrolase
LLAQNAALLEKSRVPVVIDHYGLYTGFQPDQPEGGVLLKLLKMAHVWIKLSAPYRVSMDPLATRADPSWLAAILTAASDRCLWGSDWPNAAP